MASSVPAAYAAASNRNGGCGRCCVSQVRAGARVPERHAVELQLHRLAIAENQDATVGPGVQWEAIKITAPPSQLDPYSEGSRWRGRNSRRIWAAGKHQPPRPWPGSDGTPGVIEHRPLAVKRRGLMPACRSTPPCDSRPGGACRALRPSGLSGCLPNPRGARDWCAGQNLRWPRSTPVAVFRHDQGLVAIGPAVKLSVLPRMHVYVVAVNPPAREHLVARILLMTDRPHPVHERSIHRGLIEGELPQHHARMVAVAPDQLARVLKAGILETRQPMNCQPGMQAITTIPSSSQASRKCGECG